MLRKFIKKISNTISKSGVEPTPQSSVPIETKLETPKKPEDQTVRHSLKTKPPQHRRSVPQQPTGTKQPVKSPREQPNNVPKREWDLAQFEVAPLEGKTRFHDLGLPTEIMHGICDLGFEYCTPIQASTLPKALTGLDISGRAQTGTGKSAAFLITMFTRFKRNPLQGDRSPGTPRALIMVPTRELALQMQKDANLLGKYSGCKVVAVFGGMDYQKQKQLLAEKVVDIIAATPGRLLDFHRQGDLHLNKVEILVIDEADQMLDMGFIPDIRQIVRSTPPKANRQTMFFGATLTPEVARLAAQWTHDPFTVDIEPEQVAVNTIDQIVYLTTARERFALLYNTITQQNLKRVIVFCNRRDQTRRLADRLSAQGLSCAVLSGDIRQTKRITTLENFRSGKIRVMVATDVAGRGIHVTGISHVVNYNLPIDPEDYVHRLGRTGRAGATGTSISFATEDESFLLPAIEEFLGEKLRCIYPEDALLASPPPPVSVPRNTSPKPYLPRPKRRGPRKNTPG